MFLNLTIMEGVNSAKQPHNSNLKKYLKSFCVISYYLRNRNTIFESLKLHMSILTGIWM